MEKNKISRKEIEEVVRAIQDAGFQMYAIGNFNLSGNQIVNILMIALGNKGKKKSLLKRYYDILHDRYFGKFWNGH